MKPLATPSPVLLIPIVATVLACGLALLLGQHLWSIREDTPGRVFRAQGYVSQVRRLLESPRQVLVLQQSRESALRLEFHLDRADEEERKFYQHSQWLRRDIQRYNDGEPGFFRLRRVKGKVQVDLDEYAHDVPLPAVDQGAEVGIQMTGGQVPVLRGEGLRLMFDPPLSQAGREEGAQTLEGAQWLPGGGVKQHQGPAFLLRVDGANLMHLRQPKQGQPVMEVLQEGATEIRLNGIPVNRGGAMAELAVLKARLPGHKGQGIPLMDGDRLLVLLKTGEEHSLRYGLARGELRFDSQSVRDCTLLGQAARAVKMLTVEPEKVPADGLPPFTLDSRLQPYLEKKLHQEVARLDSILSPRIRDVSQRPACIAVLDALSGETLALASYPDPATLARWNAVALRGEETGITENRLEALHRNQNLQRIPIGSTIKPILATAIWETAPVLRRLQVTGGPTTRSMYGHAIHPSMNNPSAGVHWTPVEWLKNSSNPYTLAAYLAALAPARSYTLDARGQLKPNGGKLDLGGYVRGQEILTSFYSEEHPPAVNAMLRACFSISLREPSFRYDASVIRPWLDSLGIAPDKVPAALRPLLPEMTHLKMQGYRDLRNDLVSMVIGGGENRWTNLKLAEAYARIGTGRMVEATLVRRAAEAKFAAMPVSPATLSLVREGMTAAVMQGGTASSADMGLRPALEKQSRRLAAQGLRLVVHGKTGTATRLAGRECAALALYLAVQDGKGVTRAALACTLYLEDRAGSANSASAVRLGAGISDALIAHLERQARQK